MTDAELLADLPRDLHYVDGTQPGIRRKKVRGKFQYFGTKGERITYADEVQRLNALAVPPAYTDMDLRRPAGPSASHRPRGPWSQAVPLSPALARGAR